ncbi:MAG TPA: outer membrane beta-barrel protein [Terriglobales bacterium]|nr:outer membrane beta-barrel protein [Terriglobales bacterium]
MRKFVVALFSFFLFSVAAGAQIIPKGNVFGGYSYNRVDLGGGDHSGFNGWAASLEGKVFPLVGIVADFSGYSKSPNGISTKEYNFLFGPRVSMSIGNLRPFAEALAGAAHVNSTVLGSSTSDTNFAYALGGGVDYKFFRTFAWRVQGDFLQTRFFSNTQNDVRVSTGLVFNF